MFGISLIVIVLWFIKKIIGSFSLLFCSPQFSLFHSFLLPLRLPAALSILPFKTEEEQHPSITANMSSVLSSPMRCNPEFIFQSLPAPSSLPSEHPNIFSSNYQTEIWILLKRNTAVQGCMLYGLPLYSDISLQCLQYFVYGSDCLQIVVFRLRRPNNRNLCRETFKECEAL